MIDTTNKIVGYSVASPIINSFNILIDNGQGGITTLPDRIKDMQDEYFFLSDEALLREANLAKDLREEYTALFDQADENSKGLFDEASKEYLSLFDQANQAIEDTNNRINLISTDNFIPNKLVYNENLSDTSLDLKQINFGRLKANYLRPLTESEYNSLSDEEKLIYYTTYDDNKKFTAIPKKDPGRLGLNTVRLNSDHFTMQTSICYFPDSSSLITGISKIPVSDYAGTGMAAGLHNEIKYNLFDNNKGIASGLISGKIDLNGTGIVLSTYNSESEIKKSQVDITATEMSYTIEDASEPSAIFGYFYSAFPSVSVSSRIIFSPRSGKNDQESYFSWSRSFCGNLRLVARRR